MVAHAEAGAEVARALAVFEAQQLRRHHDVVVHELADRLRVLDLVLVDLDERLDRLGPADREAQHAEPHARGLLERRRVAGRDPHRRVRRGVRLRQHVARRHREEPAVEARVLLGAPHLAELAHHLVEHVAREVGIGDAEAALLGGRRAAAHAELEAALRQVVEHRDPLGDARRVVHRRRDVEDPRAEVDARGRGREIAEEHLVGREMGVLGEEVVLGRPRVLEADAVGRLHDRDLVHDAPVLVAAKLRQHARAVEQSEFHDHSPSVPAVRSGAT